MLNIEQYEFMNRLEELFSSDNWENVYQFVSENPKAFNALKEQYNEIYKQRDYVCDVKINYSEKNNNLVIVYFHSPKLPPHYNLEEKIINILRG